MSDALAKLREALARVRDSSEHHTAVALAEAALSESPLPFGAHREERDELKADNARLRQAFDMVHGHSNQEDRLQCAACRLVDGS